MHKIVAILFLPFLLFSQSALSVNLTCQETPDWLWQQPDKNTLFRLADTGDSYAQYIIGLRIFTGKNRHNYGDENVGIGYLTKASQQGCGHAIYTLFEYYFRGSSWDSNGNLVGYDKNWEQRWPSICQLTRLLEEKNLSSIPDGSHRHLMAQCYLMGLLVKESISKGIAMLQHAARNQKNAHAANQLAEIYEQGSYGVAKSVEKAIEWRTIYEENKSLYEGFVKCKEALGYFGKKSDDMNCFNKKFMGFSYDELEEFFSKPSYSR